MPLMGAFAKEKKMRFQFIQENESQWPVSVMCDVLKVSRLGYYA
jgi:hypothetical protein